MGRLKIRIKSAVRKFLRDKMLFIKRRKLKNKDFSIIASNCTGGFVLHDFHIKFNTPTINLFFYPDDFLRYVQNLPYYSQCELTFVQKPGVSYPVGLLEDVEIYFMHYKTEAEARQKWEERTQRINYNNLFIIMTDLRCTPEHIRQFDALPYKNKVLFTNKCDLGIPSAFYIKGFDKDKDVGQIFDYKTENSLAKYYDDFDFAAWFNGETF